MGKKPLGVLLKGKGFRTRVERRRLKSQVTHSHSRSDRSAKWEKMMPGREILGDGGRWQALRMDVSCAAEQNMELNDTVQPDSPGSLHTKHLYVYDVRKGHGTLNKVNEKGFQLCCVSLPFRYYELIIEATVVYKPWKTIAWLHLCPHFTVCFWTTVFYISEPHFNLFCF